MDDDVKHALFDLLNTLDGKIFALQRAVRVLINRDPDPDAARAAIEKDLDGVIAMAPLTELTAERKASMRKVQAHLLKQAKDDPA